MGATCCCLCCSRCHSFVQGPQSHVHAGASDAARPASHIRKSYNPSEQRPVAMSKSSDVSQDSFRSQTSSVIYRNDIDKAVVVGICVRRLFSKSYMKEDPVLYSQGTTACSARKVVFSRPKIVGLPKSNQNGNSSKLHLMNPWVEFVGKGMLRPA